MDASSKREAKLSPYSKEAVLKREAQARANSVAEDRCVNTIHSNYVTDHRCQRERGHEGDCWFGRLIPNRVHPVTGYPVCEFGCTHAPGKQCDCACHATRNRVPSEDELREVMAACWDHEGWRSNREANGYPKMAKALRAFLLERMA